MPRPEARTITFTIDGQDVQVPENTMLVDAAKHGDVEILGHRLARDDRHVRIALIDLGEIVHRADILLLPGLVDADVLLLLVSLTQGGNINGFGGGDRARLAVHFLSY